MAHLPSSPDWPVRIQRLLRNLNLTQAGLAERLGVSPATVSRWIQGRLEPTAQTYVALGNLARPPDSVYFWERAGVNPSGYLVTNFGKVVSSLRIRLEDYQLVAAKNLSRPLPGSAAGVAVPLLNVTAWGDRVAPKQNITLSQAQVENVLVAPLDWCAHPDNMIAMHIEGDSMDPVIPPASIVFVDTAVTERDHLNRCLAVIGHRDLGFKIARFQRFSGADLMVSANHRYPPLDVSNVSRWKILGQVLWWVSRDLESGSRLDPGS